MAGLTIPAPIRPVVSTLKYKWSGEELPRGDWMPWLTRFKSRKGLGDVAPDTKKWLTVGVLGIAAYFLFTHLAKK